MTQLTAGVLAYVLFCVFAGALLPVVVGSWRWQTFVIGSCVAACGVALFIGFVSLLEKAVNNRWPWQLF